MSTAFGQSVVQPATQEQSGVVFFLHGLGEQGFVLPCFPQQPMDDAAALSYFKPQLCMLPGRGNLTYSLEHRLRACMYALHAHKIIDGRVRNRTYTYVYALTGDSEHVQGLLSTGPSLKLPHVKFIYPWAPEIPITLFGGASRYAWFDMANPGKPMPHVMSYL